MSKLFVVVQLLWLFVTIVPGLCCTPGEAEQRFHFSNT